MIDLLSKDIDDIGIEELQELIDSEVPEGQEIEFKKEPPGDQGKPDPWMTGAKIGNYAKNRILKEVVAFANAYGGVLLIGIDESEDNPAVASRITPVPRCADLAESLKLVFRDRVEPQLTRIDIAGIPTEEDGSGIVIIRVGKSRLAPHRVTRTLVCPIRRADRSEEMTMREIQDMTLNVSRGLQWVREKLADRSARFPKEFDGIEPSNDRFGIRMTAVPVAEEIRIDSVFRQGAIDNRYNLLWRRVIQRDSGGERSLEDPPDFRSSFSWPLLRGARAEDHVPAANYLPSSNGFREIYCDGLVELGLVSIADEEHRFLDPDWPIVMFANLAAWADRVRTEARALSLEYAIEVETYILGKGGFVRKVGHFWPRGHHTPPRLRNAKFPVYPLNNPDAITDLLCRFYRDFRNSMHEDAVEVDFVLK